MRSFLLLLFGVTTIGFAQQSYGYGFLGGTFSGHGDMSGAFRYGIGGEVHVVPHLTMGGEIGGITKNGTGVLVSGNASFHIPVGSDPLDPFVTAGFSIGHKSGSTGAYVNLGGGVNYWVRPHFGGRLELRGYPGGQDLGGFGEIRIGVVFR